MKLARHRVSGVEWMPCECLEISLRAELEDTRVSDAVDCALGAVIRVGPGTGGAIENPGVDPGELRMVPGVEGLELQLDAGLFREAEVFEKRRVPVVASRPDSDGLGSIAPGKRSRLCDRAHRIEPVRSGVRIFDRPHLVCVGGGVATQ